MRVDDGANGYAGRAADYLPQRPVARGEIRFPVGRRFRREGPPPAKRNVHRYGR